MFENITFCFTSFFVICDGDFGKVWNVINVLDERQRTTI